MMLVILHFIEMIDFWLFVIDRSGKNLNISNQDQVPMIQLLLPIMGPITQEWSYKHPAIDIGCTEGIPVLAAHNGVGKS